MSNPEKRFICNVQIPDGAEPGKWCNVGPSYVVKDKAGVDKVTKLESRDRTFGGMYTPTNHKRRLQVREVLVVSTRTVAL